MAAVKIQNGADDKFASMPFKHMPKIWIFIHKKHIGIEIAYHMLF